MKKKEIIRENLISEFQALMKQSQMSFEITENKYYLGKSDAYKVALKMIEQEVK